VRRHFELPEEDQNFLERSGLPWETLTQGAERWVLQHEYRISSGYNQEVASRAVLVAPGYPDVQLDMVFFLPHLARIDGVAIPQTQHVQQIDGKSWQRWSRHRTAANPWRPGVDSLETHMTLVDFWIEREFQLRRRAQ
jgi:hypothetical protein